MMPAPLDNREEAAKTSSPQDQQLETINMDTRNLAGPSAGPAAVTTGPASSTPAKPLLVMTPVIELPTVFHFGPTSNISPQSQPHDTTGDRTSQPRAAAVVEEAPMLQDSGDPWITVTHKKKGKRARGNPNVQAITGVVTKPQKRRQTEYKIRLTRSRTSIKPLIPRLKVLLNSTNAPTTYTMNLIENANTISVRTDLEALAAVLEKIVKVDIEGKKIPVQVFHTYGATYCKGAIYDIHTLQEDPQDEILNLELESEKVRVVAARRLGKTNTAMLTFDGEKPPRSVLYGRRYVQVFPYKPKAVTCANCHCLAHKPDICPTATVCATCGNTDSKNQVGCPTPNALFCQGCSSKKRVVKTVHWDKFRQALEADNFPGSSFERLLNNALKEATTETKIEDAPTPDLHLLRIWAKRLQAVQRYRNGRKTPQARRAITRATVEAKHYAKQLGTNRWIGFRSSLTEKTSVKPLWAVSRAMLGKKKSKKGTSILALKKNKTEEQLADMAGDLFFPQPPCKDDQGLGNPYNIEVLAPDEGMDRPFALGELQWALHKGKSCSAPGSDKVTMTMLENLPENTKLQLLNWINLIWITGKLPEHWKHSLVIPIPKPGKDKESLNNYRPISLTSCTCKVMERMVVARMDWHLETTGAFHPAQTGFRPCLGTQESLALISSSVIRNVHKSKFRTIVAIDVKKAFESVPHSTVIKEASRLNITGRTLNFIKSFLEGTTFSVRCGRHDSAPRANYVGVPQGSVLAPTLFILTMVALPHELSKISGLEFTVCADDVSIWAYGDDLEKQRDILQSGLDIIEAHLARVGMQAAPEKTNYAALRSPRIRVKEDYAAKLNLVLAGKRIQPSPSVKILGITIEENGKGDAWLCDTLKQCNSVLSMIRRICNARGGASQDIAKNITPSSRGEAWGDVEHRGS
ncbi:uncharacterized protein ISCGN_018661 [Ixodes scapularis]